MNNYFLKLAPDEFDLYKTALATSLSDKDALPPFAGIERIPLMAC
jgi:hypothetical protein